MRRAALAGLALLLTLPAAAAELQLTPTRVLDGDTFMVGKDPYRLWGFDAPELEQPFGPEAKRELERLILGKTLACQKKGQSYKRLVVRCSIQPQGRDIGSAMVAAGFAMDEPLYSRSLYRLEEAIAVCDKIGLWARTSFVPPWAYRECKKLKRPT